MPYLNTGTGNAWAGHCNVNADPDVVTNIMPTCIVDNLGGTRPMGSEESRKTTLMWLLPVHRCWESLCCAQYREAGVLGKLEATCRWCTRKLGRYPAHRLCACWEKASSRIEDIQFYVKWRKIDPKILLLTPKYCINTRVRALQGTLSQHSGKYNSIKQD